MPLGFKFRMERRLVDIFDLSKRAAKIVYIANVPNFLRLYAHLKR